MKKLFTLSTVVTIIHMASAQTNTFPSNGAAGIGTTTPNGSSLLDVVSTTKGVLVPRMTKTQRDAIGSPATGLLIYQTNQTPGFYYYSGTAWTAISPKGANRSLSNLTAPTAVNADLLPMTNNTIDLGNAANSWSDIYLDGSIYLDNAKFISNAGDGASTFVGEEAGNSNTGFGNSAFGYQSLYSNTTGYNLTAIGNAALYSNSSGSFNTASGSNALYSNTTGEQNTATGNVALYLNTTGDLNTASGYEALLSNTIGYKNTAIGASALRNNTSGQNTALGYAALYSNNTGYSNTALGAYALHFNTSGLYNTASGLQALYSNTIGYQNTASGHLSLFANTSGTASTACGVFALYDNTTGSNNTAFGAYAGTWSVTNTFCTFLGYNAAQDVSTFFTNSTAVGNSSTITASNQVRLGNSSVTSIGGYQNWSNISDGRYKKNVKEDVPGLEFIKKLRPVTYILDVSGLRKFLGEDPSGEEAREGFQELSAASKSLIESGVKEKEKDICTGFIAQEVEVAAKELDYKFSGVDAPKNENDLYGLRYAEFVVPLVKAVQELSLQNDNLKSEAGSLKSENEKLKIKNEDFEKRIAALENQSSLPDDFVRAILPSGQSEAALLGQNIPNPFDNSTLIPFRIPKECHDASISISESATGKIVRVIPVTCRETQLSIDAGVLASGTYSYSLYVDGTLIQTKQMAIVR